MLYHIYNLLKPLLGGSNQFASGGLLLMATGSILALLRKVPAAIGSWALHQVTLQADIIDQSEAFVWFKYWFLRQDKAQRIRRVDVFTPGGSALVAHLTPAPGRHWMWWQGRPILVKFKRSEDSRPDMSTYRGRRTESFSIMAVGRDRRFLQAFVQDMSTCYAQDHEAATNVSVWGGAYWQRVSDYKPRRLQSVILPIGVKEALLDDIEHFCGAEQWYESVGIPYHRGYLLEGMPGAGKTSLVRGLADYFKVPLYFLNLQEMGDRTLMEAVRSCQPKSIILIEDADCTKASKSRQPTRIKNGVPDDSSTFGPLGVTLSGLLNTLDGVLTPHGAMFFLTTNQAEAMDAALLRPGRVDRRVKFGHATRDQKVALLRAFCPDYSASDLDLVRELGNSTMSEFQEALMRRFTGMEQAENVGNVEKGLAVCS